MSLPGTNIIAAIVPTDALDTYPTHYSQYGKGGKHSYSLIAQRDAIPLERRELGMEVYVAATGRTYTLKTGLTNADWEETISANYVDQAIENNAVVAKYRRGFNNTGSQIDAFKFVTLDNGFTYNYPNIKVIDSYDYPPLGLIVSNLPDTQTAKFPYYSILQLPLGVLDTSSIPIKTPIYCNNSGGITLNWTPLKVGYTLTQSMSPYIYLFISEVKFIKEIPFTNITNQTFIYNLGYIPNINIVDNLGVSLTSSVEIETDENQITIKSNLPITGKLIYT